MEKADGVQEKETPLCVFITAPGSSSAQKKTPQAAALAGLAPLAGERVIWGLGWAASPRALWL